MEATVGGSCRISLDPSLETGKGEEKNLEKRRLKFLGLQETGTRKRADCMRIFSKD